ncbi:MAG: lipid-A-disaccharide synthase, partial [Rhodospirillaceae bacterium]|nr:lipid-A-disaccharide synthase [Rhodospirillaceae bacterium]
MAQNRLASALEAMNDALAVAPDDSTANHAMALLKIRLGETSDAKTHFDQALVSDPGNVGARNDYGSYLCGQGKWKGGAKQFETARDDPFNTEPYVSQYGLGVCLIGAGEFRAAQEQFRAEFIGVGGSEMIALGCESLCPIDRLSVMGFVEPLRRLPELLTLKRKLRRRFLADRIDAFIGIDSPVFNLSLAKALKNKGIKTIHFVSPTIWAYRENRVFNIKKSIDLMLTLFPFEKDLYKKHKIKAECVGHPLADQLSLKDRGCNLRTQLGIPNDQTVVALLPGSRVDEVNRIAPIFFETALEALQKYPKLKFLVPFSNLETHLRLKSYMANLSIVAGEQFTLINDSHAALDASDFAFITSGTATLEALFLRKPMVIC